MRTTWRLLLHEEYFIMLLVEAQQSDVLSSLHRRAPLLLISHDWSAGLIQCIADSPDI